jgi:hypothetical protein
MNDNEIYPEHEREDGVTEDAARAAMYADASAGASRAVLSRPWRRMPWLWRGLAALVLVAAVLGYLINRSLPGSALYTTKVGMFEPAWGAFVRGGPSQAERYLSLLERRVEEAKRLRADGALAGGALAALAAQVEQQASGFTALLEEKESGIAAQDKVLFSSRAVAVARAEERIVEVAASSSPEAQDLENLRRRISALHEEEIRSFVRATPKEAEQSFISEQLAVIEAAVQDGSLTPQHAQTVENDVAEAARAIGRGDRAGAIEALMRAEQDIAIGKYLSD